MTEIELKAHVTDRKALIKKLNSFAVFELSCVRDDEYYGLKDLDGNFSKNKIRIRTQTSDSETKIFVTYKHKEEHSDKTGTIEVNDEKECEISSADALKTFLKDFGFELSLLKHKEVSDWTYEDVTLELCTVPPLGDFLELEILSPEDSESVRSAAHKKLEDVLKMCGIPRSQIETRYYSDLLREHNTAF